MIVRDFYMKRPDGVDLYATRSDSGFYIERDGVKYEEAVDPAPEYLDRIYTETNERIPPVEGTPEEALDIILGGADV